MLPLLDRPLALRDNLQLTPNTPSGLWSATASGREPRFPLFAVSGRWKILGRLAKGCFSAPAPKAAVGQKRTSVNGS